jgi:hypothetical protein
MTLLSLPTGHYRQTSLLGIVLSSALCVGCSSIPTGLNQSAPLADRSQIAIESAETPADSGMPGAADSLNMAASPPVATAADPLPAVAAPQLVRQANLVVVLTDLDAAVAQVQEMMGQVQGDLLKLQDHRSPEGIAHQITLTLRVPQERLEPVLDDIRGLGTIQQQSITAEDVSNQLVDIEARLKNLRKSETALLEIMERSGDIADVLEVSRELSNVRESIERMAAQQQNLKQRVAYSHIHLTLKSPTYAVAPLRPAGETLDNTWQAATRSVKAFTLGGLKLGLWLLAYSPYIAVVAIFALGGYRLRHPRPVVTPEGDSEQG